MEMFEIKFSENTFLFQFKIDEECRVPRVVTVRNDGIVIDSYGAIVSNNHQFV